MNEFSLDPNTCSTYLLGLTGSGKSTLINYMMGAMLTSKKTKGFWKIQNEAQGKYPTIGNDSQSCITFPAIFKIEKNSFVDSAGFLDTKGLTQQIINSYANATMFKRGAKTKILVVVERATLESARGGSLVDVAVRLRELFPKDFIKLIHSIAIVVSKVNLDDLEEDDVIYRIQSIIKHNENLPEECQMMLKTIVYFKRVIIFPYPRYMSPEKVTQIKTKIQGLRDFTLSKDATISLSPSAKIQLDDLARGILDNLNGCSKLIKAKIEEEFLNKHYKKAEELEPVIGKLRSAISILTTQLDAGQMESFEKFAKLVDLSAETKMKVQDNYQKMEFCRALHTDIKTNVRLIDSVINSLRESQSILDSQLQQILTKEQIEQMNQRHEKVMTERKKEFDQMTYQMKADAQKREKQARKNLEDQKNFSEKMMKDSNEKYQKNMEKLQNEIIKLRDRKPEVVYAQPQHEQLCSIM